MYKNDNFKNVKTQMEQRRLAAIAEADRRTEEVRLASPEIRQIDRELTKTGLSLFRMACAGEDIAPLRERNQALCKRRGELLRALGYTADYTEVHYACPKCKDTGYVDIQMCSCLREAVIRENLRTSGVGHLIDQQSFHNFDLERYRAQGEEVYSRMRTVFLMARSFAKSFERERGNLLMIGPTGTGKTHLSTAIAREVIEQGFDVLYDSAQNIVNAFEHDRFHAGYGESERRGQKYLDCTLLILDDLGTEFVNSFTVSCLYNLFNERQNKGLSTVISTNLSATELTQTYEDRIYSRIIGKDYRILSFVGNDSRLS